MFNPKPNNIINSREWYMAAILYISRQMNTTRTQKLNIRKARKAERQNRKLGRINARNA